MEVFDGHICITGTEALKVIPEGSFCSLLHRGKIRNLSGKAGQGHPALYPVEHFPRKYRILLYAAYPELSDEEGRLCLLEGRNAILRNLLPDPRAHDFFQRYEKCPGVFLTPDEVSRYKNSAMILNAIQRVYEQSYSRHAASGKAGGFREMEFWKRQAAILLRVSEQCVHTLPRNHRGLQRAYKAYAGNNYPSLLSGKIGNHNRTKKRRALIEQIVVSIYGSADKPFMSAVCARYNEFVCGLREIYNHDTGEVFNRADFYHKGEAETISDSLVFNILNKPLNRKIVDRLRNDFHYNQNRHNASVDRQSPYHSLSKISMDDRDLRRKALITVTNKATGKVEKKSAWVHAYYAFDVASDTCIGAAYSLKKDTALVLDCFRDMWNNLRAWGLPMPAEVEVEQHLLKELAGKLERTFLHVTFCAAMNSREKRAEHKIRAKVWFGEKSERSLGMAQGRHYGKSEAYLGTREKVFDTCNDTYKEPLEPWDFERLVAADRAHIATLNQTRHTRLKEKKSGEWLYGGMTRMQVLLLKPHPALAPLNWRLLCKEWGKCTETSLKRGSTFTVDYREWWLSDAALIERFKPNDTTAQAYCIPDHSGAVNEIFVYQGERYIDSPRALGKFQEAKIERTQADERIMYEQLGYIRSAKQLHKAAQTARHLGKLGSLKTEIVDAALQGAPSATVTETPPAAEPVFAEEERFREQGEREALEAAKALQSL